MAPEAAIPIRTPAARPKRTSFVVLALAVRATVLSMTMYVPAAESKPVSLRTYTLASGMNTTLTGTETKLIRVRFSEPVLYEDVHFHVRGDGRVMGFLMRKVGNYGDREGPRQEGLRPTVWATNVGQCNMRGCQGHPSTLFVGNMFVERFEGEWDFYFVADGAEVSVSLKVQGAKGSKIIDVDSTKGQEVQHEVRTLTPRVHGTPGERIYSAGDFSSLKHVDFGMVGHWAIGDSHIATAYSPCMYYGEHDGRTKENADKLFTLGCPASAMGPTSSSVWVTESPPSDNGGFVQIARSGGPPDSPRGLGGWFATASDLQRYGAVALWIDYPDVDTEYPCWAPSHAIDPEC